jgi:hypothetical protein
MAKRDDGFEWKGDHYEVRRFFAVDIVWVIVMVAVTVAIVWAAAFAYWHRDDDPTTVDRSSGPIVQVVGSEHPAA